MPSALRKQPPLDLVEQFLRCVGLSSIHDSTLFKKEFINLQEIEFLIPLLEPYYLPCKASDFLYEPLTYSRVITLLRHILKSHNAKLIASEKCFAGVKTTWYSVHSSFASSSELTVSFD